MEKKTMTLLDLPKGKKAKIISLTGGRGFQRKLRVMGIREGEQIESVSKQPFHGPLTVKVGRSNMTIGRGMASKVIVEKK